MSDSVVPSEPDSLPLRLDESTELVEKGSVSQKIERQQFSDMQSKDSVEEDVEIEKRISARLPSVSRHLESEAKKYFDNDVVADDDKTVDVVTDFYSRLSALDSSGTLLEATEMTCRRGSCRISAEVTVENFEYTYYRILKAVHGQELELHLYRQWDFRQYEDGRLECFLIRRIE